MCRRRVIEGVLAVLAAVALCSATVTEVVDSDIGPGDVVVWRTGDTLLLNETVYVDSGAELTIEPGVVVRARRAAVGSGTTVHLVVCRHARIRAQGTSTSPILFTSELDTFALGRTAACETAALWGGVAILGAAPTNVASAPEQQYAPVNVGGDPRLVYGGTDTSDTSGSLRYVSIRFAGKHDMDTVELAELADASADLVTPAGLALCGVGRGTRVEFVEVYASGDDNFRMVGGTVECRYLCSVFSRESSFDFEQGHRGACQYLLAVQSNREPIALHQRSEALVANATFVTGAAPYPNYFENATGAYYNSIFFNGVGPSFDPYGWQNVTEGTVQWRNCIFGKNASYDYPWEEFLAGDELVDYIPPYNSLGNPEFALFSGNHAAPSPVLDLRPGADLAVAPLCVLDTVASFDSRTSRLEDCCYRGAFDPTAASQWTEGWTSLDYYGWLAKGGAAPRSSLPNCTVPTRSVAARQSAPGQRMSVSMADGSLHLATNFTGSQRVSLALHDLSGRRIAALPDFPISAGYAVTAVPFRGLAKGTYLCVVRSSGRIKTFTILVR